MISPKISVCLPVYQRRVDALTAALQEQLSRCGQPWEGLLCDDGSTEEIRAENRAATPEGFRWLESSGHLGRAAVRNYLAREAKGEWLLFLDCDALIDNQNFINNYLKEMDEVDALVGGTAYRPENTAPDYILRRAYGLRREVRPAALRQRHPFAGFSSFNVAVRRDCLAECPFDEACREYGHEDTLLGLSFERKGYRLRHLDNPAVHNDHTDTDAYLASSRRAVEKFVDSPLFARPEVVANIKILRVYRRICTWGIDVLLSAAYPVFRSAMEAALHASRPSIRLFDVYRLAYACWYCRRQREVAGTLCSVVIPYLNRADTLPRCLASIRAQRWRPLELILVDNGSTDTGAELCREFAQTYDSEDFRVILLDETKPGACAARNRGLEAATGAVVGFFDSDDEMHPERIATLMKAFAAPRVRVSAGSAILEENGGLHRHPKHVSTKPSRHLMETVVSTHAFLTRRDWLLACVGRWNTDLSRWQDLEYGFRLLSSLDGRASVVWHRRPLYTIHAGRDSISAPSFARDADKLRAALSVIEADMRENGFDRRAGCRFALSFKKTCVAAALWRENGPGSPTAMAWWKEALDTCPKAYRLLLKLHFSYTRRGGRGFWRWAKHFA